MNLGSFEHFSIFERQREIIVEIVDFHYVVSVSACNRRCNKINKLCILGGISEKYNMLVLKKRISFKLATICS